MRACMCSLFHLALGNQDGGVQLIYALVAWRAYCKMTGANVSDVINQQPLIPLAIVGL